MAEEVEVGCARPTGGPVGVPVEEIAEEKSKPVEKETSMIHVGEKVPDFVAPGYQQGKFINVKLSEYLGKWTLLCFYPGDFTFVGATELPANMAFAAVGSDDLMYRATSAGAVEGRAMGIHLTYTPVVDISLRPENPAESVRSFGGDLELLGRMVTAYVRGYHDNGMLTTAKHFPGRGDIDPMPGNAPFAWASWVLSTT